MAAGTAASAMSGGAGNNFMNPAMGALGAAGAKVARQRKTTSVANPKAAFGGAGMVQRFENLESRLDALEKPDGDAVQSVQPIQKFVQGGSFSEIPSTPPPAPVATGTLNASTPPGSLDEAMPSPGDPASDMFGTEFMRSASVGAAKMRMNKKI